MQQQNIHNYLERYFKANQCTIEENKPDSLVVQLTVELDKHLMNRPFYWHYLEKIGGVPQPMKLMLHTSKTEKSKGEFIHFGSPRLHQIFDSSKKLASFIRLYEDTPMSNGKYTPLTPWLGINVKISYQCDRKKDILYSLGLQLMTGQMIINFEEQLEKLNVIPKLPDYCFPLTPLIKPQSGMNRLKRKLQEFIENDDHTWAVEARQRWQDDLVLLNQFYEGKEEDENFQNEKEALRTQYEPNISIEIINGGLFYLKTALHN
ncbi:YqhG family protein [Bacillus taeanensis]|uniref:YqhG family protein n=1 Tax=Bacillus taeanensis TaxID=273032 RepID=A0A366Y2G5_9BACI|nr:YqhG family protein [Bacillus taeanensis]RBW70584.1 hypothetical protein DS031_06085 [Bacillus taeanensis]